jgi:hypothetical protein
MGAAQATENNSHYLNKIYMKEKVEFRIKKKYYNLLSQPNNGKDNGMVYVVSFSIGRS